MNDVLVPLLAGGSGVALLFTVRLLKQKEQLAQEQKRLAAEQEEAKRKAALAYDRTAQIEEANRLLIVKEYEEAMPYYERFVEETLAVPDGDPRLAFCYPLGLCYAELDRFADATPLFLRALTFYDKRPHPDGADVKKALAIEADIHARLAKAGERRGAADEIRLHARLAAERFEEAGERSKACAQLAILREHEGEFLWSAELCQEALTNAPTDPEGRYRPELLYRRAMNLWRTGWVTAAASVAIEAWQSGADRIFGASVPILVARCYGQLGKFDLADGYLRRAQEMVRNEAERIAATEVTVLHMAYRGCLTDALSYLRDDTAKLDQPNASLIGLEARLSALMGRFAESVKSYRSAIKLIGGASGIVSQHQIVLQRNGLALALCDAGELEEAARTIDAAIKLSVHEPYLRRCNETLRLRIKARSHSAAPESVQAASQVFVKTIDERIGTFDDPNDALRFWLEPLHYIAEALLDVGDAPGCRALLARFTESDALLPWSLPRHYFLYGQCYEREERPYEAIAAYEKAAESAGGMEMFHASLAQVRLAALAAIV